VLRLAAADSTDRTIMKNKPIRTKIGNLPQQPRALDIDELADVTGGLMRGGGGGGGSTWTWTEPAGPDDIYRRDDE
jgi:hypothetical protein